MLCGKVQLGNIENDYIVKTNANDRLTFGTYDIIKMLKYVSK